MASAEHASLNWGIVGSGLICQDFVTAIAAHLDPSQHRVLAVAARKLESAEKFAAAFNIPRAVEGYESLLQFSDIHVFYVGTINPNHFPVVKRLLEAGKNVLCEKPLCMNVRETEEIVRLARQKKVFLMEAVWSRCTPAQEKLTELLNSDTIGDVVLSDVTFGRVIDVDRMLKSSLGGGTTLDLGVYCIQLANLVHGSKTPVKVVAAGHLDESEGTDVDVSAVFIYENGQTSRMQTHCMVDLPCEAIVYGTRGFITLRFPFWSSTRITVSTKDSEKVFEFPLPRRNPGYSKVEFNFYNSSNLAHEAHHVRECLHRGWLESPKMSLEESLTLARQMETIRKQVGVTYSQD